MNLDIFVFTIYGGVVVAGLVWFSRWYGRTPPTDREGWGKLAPAQQRVWERFILVVMMSAVALGLVSTLLR